MTNTNTLDIARNAAKNISAKMRKNGAAMQRATKRGDIYTCKKLACKQRILKKSLEIVRLASEIEAEEIMLEGYDYLRRQEAEKALR